MDTTIVYWGYIGLYRGIVYQDPPCTHNWGYMVPDSGYLGRRKV